MPIPPPACMPTCHAIHVGFLHTAVKYVAYRVQHNNNPLRKINYIRKDVTGIDEICSWILTVIVLVFILR